jgi:hypothetical protein
LDVYSISGQHVITLLDKKQSAGIHHTIFNAEQLASGIYIYRIKVGELIKTRKMIIVK